MKTSASGTIYAGSTVNIDRDPAPSPARQRVLWHVSQRPVPAGYFEARAWFVDLVTREYHEGSAVVLACSIDGAKALLPRGLEDVDTDGADGTWLAPPKVAAGAQPRAAMPSMPIRTLEGAA